MGPGTSPQHAVNSQAVVVWILSSWVLRNSLRHCHRQGSSQPTFLPSPSVGWLGLAVLTGQRQELLSNRAASSKRPL